MREETLRSAHLAGRRALRKAQVEQVWGKARICILSQVTSCHTASLFCQVMPSCLEFGKHGLQIAKVKAGLRVASPRERLATVLPAIIHSLNK